MGIVFIYSPKLTHSMCQVSLVVKYNLQGFGRYLVCDTAFLISFLAWYLFRWNCKTTLLANVIKPTCVRLELIRNPSTIFSTKFNMVLKLDDPTLPEASRMKRISIGFVLLWQSEIDQKRCAYQFWVIALLFMEIVPKRNVKLVSFNFCTEGKNWLISSH